MKRKITGSIIFFLVCLLFFWGRGDEAQAANYKLIGTNPQYHTLKERTVGLTTFETLRFGSRMYLYAMKSGKRIILASGNRIGDNIITDGSTVYYSGQVSENAKSSVSMYRISSAGKKRKKLFSVLWDLRLEGYYNGTIFYTKGEWEDDMVFCSYNIKSRKRKDIAKGMHAKRYKNYYYMSGFRGDFCSIPFRVYNVKNKKIRTISKEMLEYSIASNQVYYLEGKEVRLKNGRCIYNSTIKKCALSGTGQKTLVKKLKFTNIIKFTNKYLTYYDENGKKKIKRF